MDESCSTEPLDALHRDTCRSVFCCPKSPFLIWELDNSTSLQITIVVTSIACPAIVILNLLVILTVKTRRELKKTSTIMLCSLAVADLLVGALSMPLTITLDALMLQKMSAIRTFCSISYVNEFLMYTTWGASFIQLLVIAWERYVAVHKWREYGTIVTTCRLKKNAVIAWLVSLLTVLCIMLPARLSAGVLNGDIVDAVYIVWGIAIILCLLLIGYFYVEVYRGIRKWNRSQFRKVNTSIKRKREVKTALTTFLITVFASVTTIPYLSVLIFRHTSPLFRKSSLFRWSEMFLQLNSLLNPIFYFYRNQRFRRATLELLKIRPGRPQRIQELAHSGQLVERRRHYDSALSLDFGKLKECPGLGRSQSCAEFICLDAIRDAQHVKRDEHCKIVPSLEFRELTRKRSKSCGAVMYSDKIHTIPCETVMQRPVSFSWSGDAIRPNKLTVTVQIESAARMKAMKSQGNYVLHPSDQMSTKT